MRIVELLRETSAVANPARELRSALRCKQRSCSSSSSSSNSGTSSALVLALEEGLEPPDWEVFMKALDEVQPLTLLPEGRDLRSPSSIRCNDGSSSNSCSASRIPAASTRDADDVWFSGLLEVFRGLAGRSCSSSCT